MNKKYGSALDRVQVIAKYALSGDSEIWEAAEDIRRIAVKNKNTKWSNDFMQAFNSKSMEAMEDFFDKITAEYDSEHNVNEMSDNDLIEEENRIMEKHGWAFSQLSPEEKDRSIALVREIQFRHLNSQTGKRYSKEEIQEQKEEQEESLRTPTGYENLSNKELVRRIAVWGAHDKEGHSVYSLEDRVEAGNLDELLFEAGKRDVDISKVYIE